MAFAAVQSWTYNSGVSGLTTHTLTVSGATANNLLVGFVSIRLGSSATWVTPTGWTLIQDGVGDSASALYYRIASGDSSDNFAPEWGASARCALVVSEFSGMATSSVLETSNENETNISGSSSSATTGSITPSTAGAAVAVAGWITNGWGWDTDVTIDSSFTKYAEANPSSNFRADAALAYKDLSDTSAVNPTWTGGGSGSSYTAIAAFVEAASGSYTLTAATHSHTTTFNASGLTAARSLTAAVTSYSTSFVAANLNAGVNLTADVGSYTTTFNASGLIHDSTLTAALTTYSTTFNAATLTYTAGSTLTADTVSYTTSFTATGLAADRTLPAALHTFSTTFNDVALRLGHPIVADVVSYTTTFNDSGLTSDHVLTAAVATYTTTFNDAGLTYFVPGSGTVTCTLVTRDGEIRRNLSSLSWAWFDATDPVNFIAPTDTGEIESTDGSGLIEVTLSSTTLTSGQTGTLVLRADDGSAFGAYNLTLQ